MLGWDRQIFRKIELNNGNHSGNCHNAEKSIKLELVEGDPLLTLI